MKLTRSQLESLLFLFVRGSSIVLPLLVTLGIYAGSIWTWTGVLVIFAGYSCVELVLAAFGIPRLLDSQSELASLGGKTGRFFEEHGLLINGLSALFTFPFVLTWLATRPYSPAELTGGVLSFSIMAGSITGLAAHEFIHRKDRWERRLGITIYGLLGYGHFILSHLKGHHRDVGLKKDWSTAREGENAYVFLLRAFVDGYLASWRFENARLNRQKTSGWRWIVGNFMIRETLATVLMYSIVFGLLGKKGLAIHLALSILSSALVEIINYISHYGLVRQKADGGRPEPIRAHHSWESNNKVTNWFIFDAGKHSHHHTDPNAHHSHLRLAFQPYVLTMSLWWMTVIAFIPPLYFAIMKRELSRARSAGRALAEVQGPKSECSKVAAATTKARRMKPGASQRITKSQ